MFSKTLLALTAATVLASSTGAFAQYTGFANRAVIDQPIYAQVLPAKSAMKVTTMRATMKWHVSGFNQFATEAPENKIGDRYPGLEHTYAPIASGRVIGGIVMPRTVSHAAAEVPENKIGDRFPGLEQTYQPVVGSKFVGNVNRRQAMSYGTYINEAPENKIGDRFPLLERNYSAKLTAKSKV